MIETASIVSIIQFWMAVTVCGLLAWPLAALLFPDDSDRGYLAAKPLGWLLGAYAAWLACVAGIPFWRFGWIVGLLALLAAFAAAFRYRPVLPGIIRVLQLEMGFGCVLLVGTLIRAATPDINGLEKFMDFGFVNAALRASAMPPPDMWWAGEPINYYYFGHVAAAWLIQLSGVPADHGFTLTVALIFALTALLAYRIVQGALVAGGQRIASACGAAAATLVVAGGNFHSVLYGPFRVFSPTSYERGYYFPDSTRFVGFDPATENKGFTEMPGYGFAVGDLHAHLLNLPVALLLVLVLVRIAQRAASGSAPIRAIDASALALLFGISTMCNSWDAISYGILMTLAGLAVLIQPQRNRVKKFVALCVWGIAVVAGAALLAAPFLLNFKPISSTLEWTDERTPLWQLAALYAHLIVPACILGFGLLTPMRGRPGWIAAAMLASLAIILIAIPEIAYVKDIYGHDHRRANTMFKFTFEAQPVGFLAGFILVGLLLGSRRIAVSLLGAMVAIPLLAPISYAEYSLGGLRGMSTRQYTLDGLGFLDRQRPDDRPLLDWLRAQPPERRIVMVEASGDSFTEAARLSAMSGVPTLLGWSGHEWLWRGDPGMVFRRADEIAAFYRSKTVAEACAFVRSHGVTHVAIGSVEQEKFPDLDRTVFEQLGDVLVRSGNAMIVEIKSPNCGVSAPSL
jgi:uncharacterized membrane protein